MLIAKPGTVMTSGVWERGNTRGGGQAQARSPTEETMTPDTALWVGALVLVFLLGLGLGNGGSGR